MWVISLDADLDTVFAIVDRGPKGREAGRISLASIVNARLGTVTPERDLYITLDQPWPRYLHADAEEL